METYQHHRQHKRLAWLSLGCSLGLLGIKFVAYWLTGSAAILSDALESIVNVFASSFALFSVMLSALPPDETHPYGHGRIEFFSAGFEGMLIIVAALAICWTAIPRLLHPVAVDHLSWGLLLVGGTTVVNALVGLSLQRVGRRTHSLALVADGKHLMSDAYTSAGVVGGMLLVWLTRWYVLDALIALAVALHIVIMGWKLVREAIARLMDEAEPQFLEGIVQTLQTARRPAWIDLHHLRAWRSGTRHHVDFHLTLPRYWDLQRCHSEAEEIEDLIHEAQPGHGDVIMHLDPCMPADCAFCTVRACPVRSTPYRETRSWTVEGAIGDPMFLLEEDKASAL